MPQSHLPGYRWALSFLRLSLHSGNSIFRVVLPFTPKLPRQLASAFYGRNGGHGWDAKALEVKACREHLFPWEGIDLCILGVLSCF